MVLRKQQLQLLRRLFSGDGGAPNSITAPSFHGALQFLHEGTVFYFVLVNTNRGNKFLITKIVFTTTLEFGVRKTAANSLEKPWFGLWVKQIFQFVIMCVKHT